MAGFGGAVKLTGESEYRKALKQITLDLKEVDSELKVVATQYDKNDKSQEALTAQSDALTKKLEAQAKKVDLLKSNYKAMSENAEQTKQVQANLKEELEGAVKELQRIGEQSGKTSDEYKIQSAIVASLTTEYNNVTKAVDSQEQALSKSRIEINKATSDYNTTSKALEGLDDAENDATKGSKDLGEAVTTAGNDAEKSANGGFTVLKGALANLASDAFKAGIKAIKDGLKELSGACVDAVNEVVELGSTISDNSAKLGIDAESYQEWSYILEQSGANIEGMKTSFLKLTKAIESNDSAFQELGISADELQKMDKAQVFEAVVKGLQGIQDENKKTILANQLLGKGAVELGAVLSDTTDIDALKAKIHDLGGVMSNDAVESADKMGDALVDMKTALTGIKVNLVSQFLPSINDVVDGLTSIFSGGNVEEGFKKISKGISDTANTILNVIIPNVLAMIPSLLQTGLPVIISGVETLIQSLAQQLPTIIKQLFDAVSIVLTDLAEWLSQEGNVSEMLSGILSLVVDLTNKFAELLPILLPAVVQVIAEVADFLTKPENIEMLINSTIFVVGKICEALIKSLPKVLNILKNIGLNIVTGVVNLGGKVKENFTNYVNWLKSLLSTWWTNLKAKMSQAKEAFLGKVIEVKDKVVEFVTGIFTTIKELPQKVISIGANIASSIWEGLKSKLTYLKNKIKDFGNDIIKSIKNVFKIASPSKVTKELGGYLAEGLGIGFSDEMKSVNDDIEKSLPDFTELTTGVNTNIPTTTGGLDYYTLVSAFKEALTGVDVVMDDVTMGKFVKKTVSNAIYYT